MKEEARGRSWSVHSPLLREERGNVLVMCLMLMVVFTMLGMAAIFTASTEVRIAANGRAGTQAFYAAEAGLAHAKAVLRTRGFNVALKGSDGKPNTSDDGTLSDTTDVKFGSTTYSVEVIDNDDGDGDL
ncbi:MAG: pilus assembly PilX N-terminal domain-containing protein, partial [Candidatus Tectomicrobia bacterium]|nr:pilus assembly PilX N-terminal domain-containing protein [Candidatus Tectomicrobia bacterium]